MLGWPFVPGRSELERPVDGRSISHGLSGGREASDLYRCYVVDDLDAAVARVRTAGGEAGEPLSEPYGRTSTCVDDQGTRFALWEPPRAPPSDGPR